MIVDIQQEKVDGTQAQAKALLSVTRKPLGKYRSMAWQELGALNLTGNQPKGYYKEVVRRERKRVKGVKLDTPLPTSCSWLGRCIYVS